MSTLRFASALVALGLLLCTAPPALARDASEQSPTDPPSFVLGFADLKAQLGPVMGEPIEPEHPPGDGGADTIQRTTTGLAVWAAGNLPAFTNGAETYRLKLAATSQSYTSQSYTSQGSGRVACIIWRESRGNPNARNPSGASGLGQFLPSTWATTPQGRAGLSVFNPAANAAAIQYMLDSGRAKEFDAVRFYGC